MGRDYWGPPTYGSKGQRIYDISNLADVAILSGAHMQKTVTIELKVRYSDPEKFAIVRKAAIRSANGLLAAASLISDQHKPLIAVTAHDPLEPGVEGIDILSEVMDDEE